MSRQTIFTAGSLAKSYIEVADWYGQHTEQVGAKKICVPFSGFGRLASAMCQDDTELYVCDFQHLHTAIIRGVYAARAWESNIDKPHFSKGLAYEGKCIPHMDQFSAGFVDWIAKYGTDLDVAAVGMALPSQTMRGWLSTWTGTFDKLYEKFLRTREQFRPFIGMPGNWCWIEDDIFRFLKNNYDVPVPVLSERMDVLAIDPPRLGAGPSGKDAYSSGAWTKLNAVLLQGQHQPIKIKPWTTRNFFNNLYTLIDSIDSDYIVFSWTEGNPPLEPVQNVVATYGHILDKAVWEERGKTIHAWWVKRAS